jgi:uncharacterized protein
MTNRLANATSPYLLQHQHNPVDWWEWQAEAFEAARRLDRPILLSVGYAACHWCHVMAHESFEDEGVAEVLNRDFVAIKVDREERPDIDAIYMTATTAMTGQGGWPMTCILTPGAEPFFAGTYLPRTQLLQLLAAVTDAWTNRREDVLASGANVAEQLRAVAQKAAPAAIGDDVLDQAVTALAGGFDSRNGGFGIAPKFPPSMVLEFLLRHQGRVRDGRSLQMVDATCEAMARGGMYDQLAGGFSRYSVDASWVVPHFEKMLYDNAQLLRVYVHLWRATGSPLAERVARETADFLLSDLRTPEGGFASALDADTEGVEGLTYAWTPAQLAEVLGEEDGARAATLLSVTPRGTFEHGTSTLQLRTDPADAAWWQEARGQLLAARHARPQPARDDKVISSWNGLAIAALAEAGALLEEPRYLDAARECAGFLLAAHVVDGRLRRSSRGGVVGAAAGVLDDHGNLAEGLLALHQAGGGARWLGEAARLLELALGHFGDGEGGFYDTSDDAEQLFTRPRSQADNAEPSGSSAVAGALLTYAALTGSNRHREAAEAALESAGTLAAREPRFAGWSLAVAEAAAAGPLQVAVVGEDDLADALLALARRSPSPGLVVAFGAPDAEGVPLLADRPLVRGRSAAYVCRGFVCDQPVTEIDQLAEVLAGRQP